MAVILLFITGMPGLGSSIGPEEPDSSATLFEIHRSRDDARVVYSLQKTTLKENKQEYSVNAFWTGKDPGDNRIKPLTAIQQKFGYGTFTMTDEGDTGKILSFSIVAIGDQKFGVKKISERDYRAYTTLQGEELSIKEIFVMFGNDSFLFPEISWVDIRGTDKDGESKVIRLEKNKISLLKNGNY